MAFDGIITAAMAQELRSRILLGKIEKIYQPEREALVFHIHTRTENLRLYASADSADARVHLIEHNPENPPVPLAFCMLLRKHLSGARIVDVAQKNAERIIEIGLETQSELGFTLSRKLIFEIMGKHSNIVLTDCATDTVIDCIKRISLDRSRVRQLLPGRPYQYPPPQQKIPFDQVTPADLAGITDSRAMLEKVGGISPAVAQELAAVPDPAGRLARITDQIRQQTFVPRIYSDLNGAPGAFHILDLAELEQSAVRTDFPTLSQCLAAYYADRSTARQARQKTGDLVRHVTAALDKLYLKKQRLSEDLLRAEHSEELRLFGELLTANLHRVSPGDTSVTVENYYDGSTLSIPLDPRYSPARNAQLYYKRYGKAQTAVKEKKIHLSETDLDIQYLGSVLNYLQQTGSLEEIAALRGELEETGYLRRRRQVGRQKPYRPRPLRYTVAGGLTVLAGRNNRENDHLTLKLAAKTDLWFHTKDIPGSHIILQTGGAEPDAEAIRQAAAIAAWHSKGRASQNVPVDYTKVRYVKKPSGARPGMVIFTHNHTIWVDPALPEPQAPAGPEGN